MGSAKRFPTILWSIMVIAISIKSIESSSQNTVTNADIRDAILQVVDMVRQISEKLERHELRERLLGDQLKKGMIIMDKRITKQTMDATRGQVNRLDERLAAAETIIMQKERERGQLQKTFDNMEEMQNNMSSMVTNLKQDILIKFIETRKTNDDQQKELNERLNTTASSLASLERTVLQMFGGHSEHLDTMKNSAISRLDEIKKHINISGKLLDKYENKLAEYNNRVQAVNSDSHDNWKTYFGTMMDAQTNSIEQILSNVQSMSAKIVQLPTKNDVETMQNVSQSVLQNTPALHKSSNIMDPSIKFILEAIYQQNNLTHQSIEYLTSMADNVTEHFAKSYTQFRGEIQNLGKVEQVMVQTADSVLDTKRRIEYGVHQILAEVGQLIRTATKEIVSNIAERFGNFEESVLDGENGALANLTVTIGHEIDQVWRQIGIMHQEMSANGDTLSKLQNQTDAYVNGSLHVMDGMKGKVGKITRRITEVDENLNYLLSKLSLITQEFNMIKTGLGKTLDEIRGTFKTVEGRIQDKGPGPHKINSNEIHGN